MGLGIALFLRQPFHRGPLGYPAKPSIAFRANRSMTPFRIAALVLFVVLVAALPAVAQQPPSSTADHTDEMRDLEVLRIVLVMGIGNVTATAHHREDRKV